MHARDRRSLELGPEKAPEAARRTPGIRMPLQAGRASAAPPSRRALLSRQPRAASSAASSQGQSESEPRRLAAAAAIPSRGCCFAIRTPLQAMEEEFEFLLCGRCQREAPNPKLLACLHTVCMECLEENKPVGQCPVCRFSFARTSGVPFQDNVLFSSLQAKLNTYRKIAGDRDLVCDNCKDAAEFWCSECSEFLCLKCYKSHQWYLKQKSHETQKLADLKKDTAQSFLEGAKKSSNLLCSEHTQVISIYCRGCRKPLCCSCALLDGEHYNAKLYCDIRAEIEGRKEELGRIKAELGEKRRSYEKTYSAVHERLQQLEKVRKETREEIQEKVEEMVQWIQSKGEELLAKVDSQLHQEREDVQRKLQCAERIVKRLESGERLVEKMNLFASDQEVLDMAPFVKESLDDLRKEKVLAVGFRVQADNISEVRGELQALFNRVRGCEDAVGCLPSVSRPVAPAVSSKGLHNEKSQPRSQAPTYTLSLRKTPHGFVSSISCPVKRLMGQTEKSIQASPKAMKLEDRYHDNGQSSKMQVHYHDDGQNSEMHVQDVGLSSWSPSPRESTPEREQCGAVNAVELLENSVHEICESEVASILISSSEDTEDDMM
uniref:protein PML-like isoform X1 n=2 Tax=Podarcis muralis TaxID=64176 RepID=UPI0010A038F8|nr:protein PML-like isoform X1 [Podarcis muralis]